MTANNWFERLTGFAEGTYASTQDRLAIEQDEQLLDASGRDFGHARCARRRVEARLEDEVAVFGADDERGPDRHARAGHELCRVPD